MSFAKNKRSDTDTKLIKKNQANDEKLRHLIKCPVCLDKFTRHYRAPICFPCGHSVCDVCAGKLIFKNLVCCCMCQAVSFFGPAPLGRNLQLIDLLEYANLLDPEPEPLRVLPDPSSTTLPVNALNNIQERDLFGFFKFCSLINVFHVLIC
uniref:RING-type domain-containing protein n=1 Tax=Panagrolaimus superbus TaxID=310955 RepID=A0A914Z9Q2_9BILA